MLLSRRNVVLMILRTLFTMVKENNIFNAFSLYIKLDIIYFSE